MKEQQQDRKILIIRAMEKNGKDNDSNDDHHQLSSYLFECKELSPTNPVLCFWTVTVSGHLPYLSPIFLVQVTS